jgi:hypothetical protein
MPQTPSNMKQVKLPSVQGLAAQQANALLAWHPHLSVDLPLLVVLFFHGREPDPQNFAWRRHLLPQHLAGCGKNAVLLAPTMRMTAQNDVSTTYLSTHDRIATLVRDGLSVLRTALGLTADTAWVDRATSDARLLLVGYSNGYLAWSKAVKTLQSPRPATSTVMTPPAAIGHSLFDCLYWSTPLMDGVNRDSPAGNARFSANGKAIVDAAFVTTHFTSRNETLRQGDYLKVMIEREELVAHDHVPETLGPRNIVRTLLPADDHFDAVSSRSDLSHVIAATAGFDLPARLSA